MDLRLLLARARGWGVALGGFAADLLRIGVRCAVPLLSLGVLAALIASDQGQDVLLALADGADAEHGREIAGLLFLAAGSAALSASVWYSMRWLLACPAAGLPLPRPPGLLERSLPRWAGAAVPAVVAAVFAHIAARGGPEPAATAAWWFGGLAAFLGFVYLVRGRVLAGLAKLGWQHVDDARNGHRPRGLEPGEGLPPLTRRVIGWCLVLALLLMLLLIQFPVTLPRVLGAPAVAALALAAINLVGAFALSYWPLRRGLPPLWPWLVVLAGLLFGASNDNHVVRPVDERLPAVGAPLHERFAGLLKRLDDGSADGPVVLFVASEGGGIRAAYWTVAVLDALARRHVAMDERVFALSGVSGGSLGVAAWVASQRAQACRETPLPPPPGGPETGARFDTPTPPTATQVLGMDFLSPPVAGLLSYDFVQRFWPWPVALWDRSRAIESAWQRAFAHLPGQPFAQPLDALYAGCPQLPQLMLNATVVETGQRAVLGSVHAAGGAPVFANAQSLADSTARAQSLAGQVHHSARFPGVSPAGTVERVAADGTRRPAFRLVDGGYFDNSGLQSVMDLVDELQAQHFRFRPVVLVVRNSAAAMGRPARQDIAPSPWFPEVGSVVGALYNVRDAHAVTAQAEAMRRWAPPQLIDLGVPPGTPAADAPLGWALSGRVRDALRREAERVAAAAARELQTKLGLDPGAGE